MCLPEHIHRLAKFSHLRVQQFRQRLSISGSVDGHRPCDPRREEEPARKRRLLRRDQQGLGQLFVVFPERIAIKLRIHQAEEYILPENPFADIVCVLGRLLERRDGVNFRRLAPVVIVGIAGASEVRPQQGRIDGFIVPVFGVELHSRESREDIAFHPVVAPGRYE